MSVMQFDHQLLELQEPLRLFAYKLTKDSGRALDLLQETFRKALANREKFRPGTNLRAWMYTIMRNTFISEEKTYKRRQTFTDPTEDQHYLNERNPSAYPAHSLLVMGEVKAAIGRLSPTYRVPFELYYHGYKYQEIADYMNLPLGTIKNRIHVARSQLRHMLAAYS